MKEQKKGYEIKSYFAVGAFMSNTSPDLLTAGTIAHEMGHDAFGFVDVYDYGKGGDGDGKVPAIGNWSLMGSGNWGRKNAYEREGSCPTPIDAYNLLYIKPAYEKSAAAEAENFSLTGPAQIMKLKNDVKPSQYFLLQPRGYAGYDLGFLPGGARWTPSSGMLIYHVDEAIEEDIPNPNDWNEHPLVDIEEAHGGTQHLQTSADNSGKSNVNSGRPDDLFYGSKNTFSGTTDPNSNLYDSDSSTGQNTRSAIKVYNISSTIYNEGSPEGTFAVAFDVIKEPVTDDDGGDSGGGCDAGVFALLGLAGLPVIFLTKAVIPIAYRSMYNMRRTIVRKIHK